MKSFDGNAKEHFKRNMNPSTILKVGIYVKLSNVSALPIFRSQNPRNIPNASNQY